VLAAAVRRAIGVWRDDGVERTEEEILGKRVCIGVDLVRNGRFG
jgi:hypothetical protein